MTVSLVSEEDVKSRKRNPKKDKSKETNVKESYKETKERVKNQDYRTRSLNHDLISEKNINIDKFFWKYNKMLNSVIHYIYDTIEWKEWEIEKEDNPNYNQKRLFPRYRKDKDFKEDIRNDCLKNWKYSAHWVNSIVDTAFSILESWKKNYDKGKRKRNCPVAKRLFVRVKQTLMKIDGDQLRISIYPNRFIYIDLSKRYFKIDGRIGEPILTPTQIHLPIRQDIKENNKDNISQRVVKSIGWDLNKYSMDGFSPETGWIRIDLNRLHKIHNTYINKRRRINKLASKKKVVGKRSKEKYSKRERNRCSQITHEITNEVKEIAKCHGFENLDKSGMFNKRGKKWNRELGYTNWKDITRIMEYKSDIKLIDPYHTSKDCSRCGCVNKDLKGEKFVCVNKNCGLVINRQPNAAINVYLDMEGLSHNVGWFDENVMRGFTQTGAECVTAKTATECCHKLVDTARKDVNELVRHLYDLMKPQFYGVKSI
jgi:putative transposase